MLTPTELATIRNRLGREPNETELSVFDAMWSEHCSYKSSKHWLKKLHTTGKQVIHGPGENAGVIDIGDGDKVAFKIESHNHPSYIEPFQGAATGAGGILRDVFTMGARPIALLNSLHFGHPDSPGTQEIIEGVIAGIGHYGNCIGVPTVSSKVHHHKCYERNPLVNAMAVGYTNGDIFTSVPSKHGIVVYVGAKTGRDGIGGATMASEQFTEGEENKRPAVQVGDPFYEKLLLEATLELFDTGEVIAAQDMGAAGLTSSTTEIASKGGVGIEIDTTKVPLREEGMQPWEILLSESQERMLFVLNENAKVGHIFDKWDLDYHVIGHLTDTGSFVVKHNDIVCDIPLKALEAEELIRPVHDWKDWPDDEPINRALIDPHWIWDQYDSEVMGNTISGINGDPAIVRIPNSKKALALTTASYADMCRMNPSVGAISIIFRCFALMKNAGATPLAITNCLNFGNPETPEIMNEFVLVVESMADICKELNLPVVSGNVSFYNETDGKGILPTPVVGIVGLIEDYENRYNNCPRK